MKDYIMSDEDFDPQDKLELLLSQYFEAGADLAESIKRNITKNNIIDKTTIIALNQFIIAANDIEFFTDKLTASTKKLN